MVDRGGKVHRHRYTRDIDGDHRALAGNCGARHPKKLTDIGADEYRCPKH